MAAVSRSSTDASHRVVVLEWVMEIRPADVPARRVPAFIMGLAIGLAILGVPIATFAVFGHHCAALSASLRIGGVMPATLAGLVTIWDIAARRRRGEAVNGVTFTRVCWGVAMLSAIVICVAVASAPTNPADCVL